MTTPHLPHLMLDLETLGTGRDAMILQIGAVAFCPEQNLISSTEGYFQVNIRHDSLDMGVADAETVAWWMKQDRYARESVFEQDEAVDLHKALLMFKTFLTTYQPDYLWGAMNFDQPILRDAFGRASLAWPLKYWQDRDWRTLRDIAPLVGVEEPEFVGVKHTAGDDAFHEAGWALLILRRLERLKLFIQTIHQADRSEEYDYGEATPRGHDPLPGKRFKTPRELASDFLSGYPSVR